MAIWITLGIIAVVVVALGFFIVGLYNSLVGARLRVKEAWSGIDVQLKRRASLIPNLVETVKGYAAHEEGVFSEIAGDEMRHHVFYREALKEGFERTSDKPAYLDRIIEATNAFAMPHRIYQLHVDFFEGGAWPIGPEILPQLMRSFWPRITPGAPGNATPLTFSGPETGSLATCRCTS